MTIRTLIRQTVDSNVYQFVMTDLAFKFNQQESNLLALAVDFFLNNVGDLSPEQQVALEKLLMEFDDILDDLEENILKNQHDRVEDRVGNLLKVNFDRK